MNRLIPLIAIEIFVWLGFLFSVFLISRGVFAISFGATLALRIATEVVRDAISAGIIFTWLLAWKKLTSMYLWRVLNHGKVTS